MDSKVDIDETILKVLNGTASDKERQVVSDWVEESKSNRYQFDRLKNYWERSSTDFQFIGHEEQKKKIWDSFLQETHSYESASPVPFFRKAWFKVAAVVLVILAPVYMLLHQYEEIKVEEEKEVATVRKRNPTGQKSLIQLPDGTKVWLNSDSEISYKEGLSDSLRLISLEGEAYFDVVYDSLRPFIVSFGSLSVTVLGTEFGIASFEEERDLRVALVDGLVKVSYEDEVSGEDVMLKAGNGVVYSKESRKYRRFSKQSNPDLFEKATEWHHGKLVFDGKSFEDFVREIKRWYGVQVIIEGIPPKDWNIRASFENERLSNILDAISYNKGFRYYMKDKELRIIFD